tara:strand:+ start:243 stop:581 length:339 start_codon:yes stop_codon:yes gene_type:complete
MSDLNKKKCVPCEGGLDPFSKDKAKKFLNMIHKDWSITDDYKKIKREFKTNNHYELMSFINMVAWISNTEDHHPQITFSYNTAIVEYFTYAIDGLSENDFICASKIDDYFKN